MTKKINKIQAAIELFSVRMNGKKFNGQNTDTIERRISKLNNLLMLLTN